MGVMIDRGDLVAGQDVDVVTLGEPRRVTRVQLVGVIDLVEMRALVWPGDAKGDVTMGAKYEVQEIPADLADRAAEYREKLLETVAETDEALLEKYLGGEELTIDEIKGGLRKLTVTSQAYPVLCGSAFKNKGVQPMLDAVIDYLPTPLDVAAAEGHVPGKEDEIISRKPSADEPFSGLDPIAVDVVAGVLQSRAAAGVGVLFSSHQLDVVERLCDELVIIAGGTIRATGSRDELRAASASLIVSPILGSGVFNSIRSPISTGVRTLCFTPVPQAVNATSAHIIKLLVFIIFTVFTKITKILNFRYPGRKNFPIFRPAVPEMKV